VIVRLSWKWEADVLSLVTGHSRRDMRVIDNLANHMSGNHHADSRQDDCKHSYDKPTCMRLTRSLRDQFVAKEYSTYLSPYISTCVQQCMSTRRCRLECLGCGARL
jgi:hypothetical protein